MTDDFDADDDDAGCGLLTPTAIGRAATQISDDAVRLAESIIDKSGVVGLVDGWRQADRGTKGPGGRPSLVSTRTVLIGLQLIGNIGEPTLVTCVTEALLNRISADSKTRLEIPISMPNSEMKAFYQRTMRAVHRVLEPLDPYTLPRHRRLTTEEYAKIVAARDPKVVMARRHRLEQVADALLHASFMALPREVRRRWKGSLAIDATLIKLFARGINRDNDRVGIEPDAAWYVREGDHGYPDDVAHAKGKKMPKKHSWGYEATLAVMGPDQPEKSFEFPLLVLGMAIHKPGHEVGNAAIRILKRITDRGLPANYLVGDRAYLPNSKPENFQLPAKSLRYKLVGDYKIDALGLVDNHAGAGHVEGHWYCPSMPQPLVDATKDHRAGTIDEPTWRNRLEQRGRYRLRPKENADVHGNQPLMCPAVGPSATAICPLKKVVGKSHGRTVITVTPAEPDRICTQQTVSFPALKAAKYAQDLVYESPEWQAMYRTLRNVVEGKNALLKDGNGPSIGDPTRRRMRGMAAQALLVAVGIVAENLRRIQVFLAEASAAKDGVLRRLPPRRIPKGHSLIDYLPATGTDPPT